MTNTAIFEALAFSSEKREPKHLHVIGPYSVWPRQNPLMRIVTLKLSGVAVAVGLFLHCGLPGLL